MCSIIIIFLQQSGTGSLLYTLFVFQIIKNCPLSIFITRKEVKVVNKSILG